MNENEAELISMRYFNMATHYVGTISKISEAARGIKNSQSDTAVIDWLNQTFDTLAQARRQADEDMRSVLLDIKAMSTRIPYDNYEEYRNPVVKIKLFPGGKMPEKKTAGAAAYDCYARVCDGMQDVWVFLDEGKNKYYLDTINGRTGKYPLGFALEMPPGVHAFVMARSGMGLKTQLICPIGVGLIDSDYRGEVAMLYEGYDPDSDKGSTMDEENRIYDGDRIAQLLFNVPVELVQVDELTPTERGNGGFGSTGRRDEDGKRNG